MADSTAAPFVLDDAALTELAAATLRCQGCELYRNASQTVFGAGSAHAKAFFAGEQPGDVEDRRGAPFVGPAGKLLDRAFEYAGINRRSTYVTNAVKHFRWKATAHERPAFRLTQHAASSSTGRRRSGPTQVTPARLRPRWRPSMLLRCCASRRRIVRPRTAVLCAI